MTAQQAQQTLNDMNSGKINWDDTLRAQANNALQGGGGSANDLASSWAKQIADMAPKPVTPYETVNPFSFDETLATQASTAEYAPYYQELLSDYTTQTKTTISRSQEDLQNTLTNLQAGKEYYTGVQRRLLDNTLDQVNKGYAGNGLFFSGAKQKDINQYQTEYGANMGEYNRQYEYNTQQAQTANTRTQQDVNTNLANYTRDTTREQQYAIQQGVQQRQTEATNQYEAGRTKYYESQGVYTS